MVKDILLVCIMTALFFFFPDSAFAHKVNITSWFQSDILNTESKFSCGKAVNNGTIDIFDDTGSKVLTGKTDFNGYFSFKIKQNQDLKIVLTTLCGHKSFLEVSKNEIQDAKNLSAIVVDNSICNVVPESESSYPTLEQIEFVISRQLSDKIQQINKIIAQGQQKKNDFRDILGGIGYIVGLIGVGAYFKYNRS